MVEKAMVQQDIASHLAGVEGEQALSLAGGGAHGIAAAGVRLRIRVAGQHGWHAAGQGHAGDGVVGLRFALHSAPFDVGAWCA